MVQRNIITVAPETQARLLSAMTEQPFLGRTFSDFIDAAIAAFRSGEWSPAKADSP